MWYVYIIQTDGGRTYTGISERPDRRLYEHNTGKCHSTRGSRWQTVIQLPIGTKEDAYLVERWLKTGNTRAKRTLLVSFASTNGAVHAANAALIGAKRWQAATIAKNTPKGG